MRIARPVLAAAAAGIAAAGALAWAALHEPPAPPRPFGASHHAASDVLSPAAREASDVVAAVARGRLSAALAGILAFLDRYAPSDLDADAPLAASFLDARLASGRWGLTESESLAESGEAAGAASLFAKASRALQGTSAEGETAPVEARLREALARHAADLEKRRRAAEEARLEREVRDPLRKSVEIARAKFDQGGGEKVLAELRALLKETTDPEAKRLLQAAVGDLKERLRGEGDRGSKKRVADEAVARGDFERAREVLQGLADSQDPVAAQRAQDRLDGLKDLEENKEPEALAAVRKALRWLAKQQMADGSFSVPATDEKGTAISEEDRRKKPFRTGITGMATLALLGHVRYDITDEFEGTMDRALAWIVAAQQKDGSFLYGKEDGNGRVYQNAICTLALVEADRLLHRTEFRAAAAKGIAWLEEVQGVDGGWRYQAMAPVSDVSVTGWALQSLLHARMGTYELRLGGNSLVRAFGYLDARTDVATGKVAYDASRPPGTPSMTAVALFCRLRYGIGPTDEVLKRQADFILKQAPGEKSAKARSDCYFLFYASDAMSRLGGEYWKAWGPALKKSLLGSQVAKGEAEGGWSAEGDPWGSRAGAVLVTAMNCLSLENFTEHRE